MAGGPDSIRLLPAQRDPRANCIPSLSAKSSDVTPIAADSSRMGSPLTRDNALRGGPVAGQRDWLSGHQRPATSQRGRTLGYVLPV